MGLASCSRPAGHGPTLLHTIAPKLSEVCVALPFAGHRPDVVGGALFPKKTVFVAMTARKGQGVGSPGPLCGALGKLPNKLTKTPLSITKARIEPINTIQSNMGLQWRAFVHPIFDTWLPSGWYFWFVIRDLTVETWGPVPALLAPSCRFWRSRGSRDGMNNKTYLYLLPDSA